MRALQVLVVEDSEHDTELVLRHLRRCGYEVTYRRVDSAATLREELGRGNWQLVLSDYSLPEFDAMEALHIVHQARVDIPFIIISGAIGEDSAVEALKAGAHDFVIKGRLARLVPAIERELRDAESRRRRREAESALRASEDRFRNLVESMNDAVLTIDREQRLDGVFGGAVEREGLSVGELLGKTVREILGQESAEPHESAIVKTLAGERSVYEWSLDRPAGARHFNISLSPRRATETAVVGAVVVVREITEQKRVQAQLTAADRMASVGMLAAGVAHEINNPLAAITANLELATDELAELNRKFGAGETFRDVTLELQDARECAERVRRIVRDLKLFSRANDEPNRAVDVHRALECALSMARNEIRHRARLIRTFEPVPPVLANESRVTQLFLNLLVNAARAIPEGRSNVNELRISTRASSDHRVLIEIQDTGCGMSPEVLKDVFAPFGDQNARVIGAGLSLSICERIVSSLGGEILVHSEVGKGTTFQVYLLAAAPGTVVNDEAGPAFRSSSAPPKRRGRVLIVDDEAAITCVLERCLAAHHDLKAFTHAKQALRQIAGGERFDLLICDVVMPEMTGMDLHAELTRIAPEQAARMLFLTGGAFTERARDFLSTMPNLRIEKPFDTERLRTLVATIVETGPEWPKLLCSGDGGALGSRARASKVAQRSGVTVIVQECSSHAERIASTGTGEQRSQE